MSSKVHMSLYLVFTTDVEDNPEEGVYAWHEWKKHLDLTNIVDLEVEDVEWVE